MELAEKLELAMVKYLQSVDPSPFPDYFNPAEQIRIGETDGDILKQYIRARASERADEEAPLDTGNFWWQMEAELRTPIAQQTAEEEASESLEESTAQKAKHKALAAILESAMLVDDLPAQLTAAALELGEGYELTVFGVQNRQPGRSQDDDVFSSGWTFRVYCCSRAFE